MRFIKLSLIFAIPLVLIMGMPIGYFVLEDSKAQTVHRKVSNPHGIIAYLINLDRSPERLAFVQPKIDALHLPLQRIAAIDGAKLTPAEFTKYVDFAAYHNFLGQSPKVGIIGCSLSHIKAWETFLASENEFALILEDDISFIPSQVLQALSDLTANRQYWDIANLETHHRGLPLTIKSFANDTRMVVYLVEVTHAGAYLINRHAARQLLQKALPIKMPIDHYFTRGWELDLKFVGVEPRIVKQTFGDSQIETSKRENTSYQSSLTQKVIQRIYKVQTNTIRFVYNLWNLLCDLLNH